MSECGSSWRGLGSSSQSLRPPCEGQPPPPSSEWDASRSRQHWPVDVIQGPPPSPSWRASYHPSTSRPPGAQWRPSCVPDPDWAQSLEAPSPSACLPGERRPPPTSELHVRVLFDRSVRAVFSRVTGPPHCTPGTRSGARSAWSLLTQEARERNLKGCCFPLFPNSRNECRPTRGKQGFRECPASRAQEGPAWGCRREHAPSPQHARPPSWRFPRPASTFPVRAALQA